MFKRIAISAVGILMGALLVVGAIYGTRTAFAATKTAQPRLAAADLDDEGDFDEEQRDRLAEVAVRCPVHKTLERGIRFSEEVFVG